MKHFSDVEIRDELREILQPLIPAYHENLIDVFVYLYKKWIWKGFFFDLLKL